MQKCTCSDSLTSLAIGLGVVWGAILLRMLILFYSIRQIYQLQKLILIRIKKKRLFISFEKTARVLLLLKQAQLSSFGELVAMDDQHQINVSFFCLRNSSLVI